jgi:mannose-6-phosphate isomerase-like protein (cupin superfamily)
MTRSGSVIVLTVVAALFASFSGAAFAGGGGAVIEPRAGLKWAQGGVPEVSTCTLEGDMAKGPSHFYLRYAAGFAAPLHHHSADHYITTVSGTLVLTVDGKEHRLPPGSYFALTGKKEHVARCEGSEDCVMFADARGPWDVVMASDKAKTP